MLLHFTRTPVQYASNFWVRQKKFSFVLVSVLRFCFPSYLFLTVFNIINKPNSLYDRLAKQKSSAKAIATMYIKGWTSFGLPVNTLIKTYEINP